MSRYRNTMSELLKQVRGIKEQDDKDHEISMARGELEAIADKATQLASALQGKSDDGNPLEAWVQSKITKAKDYINSVSDYLMYNPDMKQNEETILEYTQQQIKQAYGILNDPRYKGGNYDGAVAAIEKLAKGLSKHPDVANALKRANESIEEKFTVQITKKDGTTMELGRYNTAAEAQRFVDMYGKGAKVKKEEFELEEASLKDIFTANQEGQKADEIAKKLKMSVADVKKILGEETLEEKTYDEKDIDKFHTSLDKIVHKHFGHSSDEKKKEKMDEKVADSIIKDLQKAYAPMKGKTISPQMATKISKHLDQPSYDLNTLRQLVKANIPFISTIARNKIYKKTGKFEELKEEDGVEIAKIRAERDKEDNQEVMTKEKEINSLKDQINVLKTKLENEKNKAIKPMPNPETGEVPLTIGIANKLLKAKEEKEAKEKKQKENSNKLDQMTREETRLESFTRKFLKQLNESEASDKAKSLGLDYMSFGRYGKNGKVTHKSVGGSLQALSKRDQDKENKDKKPAKPKTKTTGNVKNPDGSNTTSGSVKKEILKTIKDEELETKEDFLQVTDKFANLAQDLKDTGDGETAKVIYDALDAVENEDGDPDVNSKIKDMVDALQGRPNVSKEQNKKLFDMNKLYGEIEHDKVDLTDFTKDTLNIVDQMAKVVDVSQQEPNENGPLLRSDAIENISFAAVDIVDKLEELEDDVFSDNNLNVDIKDEIVGDLNYIADESANHDNYTKVGKIVSAIEAIKFNMKKLQNKPKIKKESFNEERRLYVESIAAVKKKAEKTGMPYSILKQVYDRGMAAWKGGHRPGATQVQWALARVNSFVTKSSGTWGGADKDLAKKVRGSK